MAKIPNLFNQNPLVISQGRHTQGWGSGSGYLSDSVAIDFAYIGDLICPFDNCEVILYNNSKNGQQSYFGLRLPDGTLLICVHCYPYRTGKFNKGESVAYCTWHHYHISMIVNGKLDCIMSYLDRSTQTQTQANLYGGNTNHPDCQFSSYPDLHLNIGETPPPPQEPFKYIYPDVGSGLWALCKKAGYPVISTDQPKHESTNSICYNRIEELNGTRSVILGKAYKVDSRPLEWVDSIKLVQPQPEAQIPAQPTMPTITLPEPQVEEKLNLEAELKLVEANKTINELRSQIVARQKADILEKDLDLGEYKKESFSFLKAFKGAEKVGGITATILLFLGYLLANLSSLNGILPPSSIAQITTGIVVLNMILKSIYSTFKK
jgi:hypothetical protein